MADPVFPFGKYQGWAVSKVPTFYLAWCIREVQDLVPHFREAILAEIGRRGGTSRRRRESAPAPLAHWEGLFSRWYREMALQFHPDRGGSKEAMQAINAAADRLKELLATLSPSDGR